MNIPPTESSAGENFTVQLPDVSVHFAGLSVPICVALNETFPTGTFAAFARSTTVAVHFVDAPEANVEGVHATVVVVPSTAVSVNDIVPLTKV